jgi:hypothetical protein
MVYPNLSQASYRKGQPFPGHDFSLSRQIMFERLIGQRRVVEGPLHRAHPLSFRHRANLARSGDPRRGPPNDEAVAQTDANLRPLPGN